MSLPLKSVQPLREADAQGDDLPQQPFNFTGPWFDSRTAAAYVGNRSVNAFYVWAHKHFIKARSSGVARYLKADLDRAMKAKRPARVMSPNSLANLRKRA